MTLLQKMCALHRKYFGYLHKTNTAVFIIIPTIKQANHIAATPLLLKLAHMGMLFILHLVYPASGVHQLKNK